MGPALAAGRRDRTPRLGGAIGPLLLLSLVSSLAFAPSAARASGQFRFGTITWAPNAGAAHGVDFTLRLGYRKDFAWGSGVESWSATGAAPYTSLASATAEEVAACDGYVSGVGDAAASIPEGCTALTAAPEAGFGILLPASPMADVGQCTNPLELSPTEDGWYVSIARNTTPCDATDASSS